MAMASEVPSKFLRTVESTCSICCAKPGDSFWVGRDVWMVCEECALTVLPRLIADALVMRSRQRDVKLTHGLFMDYGRIVIREFMDGFHAAAERSAKKLTKIRRLVRRTIKSLSIK